MTDRENFVASIIEEPGDDTRRLVFADWLEENGEAERAAFVRVQIELANWWNKGADGRRYLKHENWHRCCLSYSGGTEEMCIERVRRNTECHYHGLRRRETELLKANRLKWAWTDLESEVAEDASTFTRGFVSRVACPLAAWLTRGPRIVREHPVEEVEMPGARRNDGVNWVSVEPKENEKSASWLVPIEAGWALNNVDALLSMGVPHEVLLHWNDREELEFVVDTTDGTGPTLSRALIAWAKSHPVTEDAAISPGG